jgi:oligoribonuclease
MMLAWCDLETTGLNPHTDTILEIGFIFTDDQLNELSRNSWVLPFAGQVDAFIEKMHGPSTLGGSGLLDECANQVKRRLSRDYFVPKIEGWIRIELRKHLGETIIKDARPPLCGSSIHFDYRFLSASREFSKILELFHYRMIDVSVIKELARRWAPEVYDGRPKPGARHRVLPDLEDSIAELRYYRDSGFTGRR